MGRQYKYCLKTGGVSMTRITLESRSTRILGSFQQNALGHNWESRTKTPASAPNRTGNLSSTTLFSWNLNSMRWKKSSGLTLEPSEGFILTPSLGQTFPFLASLSMFSGAGSVGEVEFDRKGTLFQFCLMK